MKLPRLLYIFLPLISLILLLPTRLNAGINPDKLPVAGTIERILGSGAVAFECHLIGNQGGNDVFEIETIGGKIILSGTSQPAIGYALNYYLTQYCHCQLSHVGEKSLYLIRYR